MQREFYGYGQTITTRMPSIDELTLFWRTHAKGSHQEAQKKLAKACLVEPPLADLLKKYPGCVRNISDAVLNVYGAGDTGTMSLDQDELGDEAAAAWVAAEGKGFGPEELFAFTLRIHTDPDDLVFIFRMPSPREIEDVKRDALSIAVDRNFVQKICVFGPLKVIEEKYIGAYTPLAMYALERAGNEEELILKK